jgi:hypothetical protein
MKLLSQGDSNPKIAKGEGGDFLSVIMHLAAHTQSGYGNVCTSASNGCSMGCLLYAGRGQMKSVMGARIARTKLWFKDRQAFLAQLFKELTSHQKKADKLGLQAVARLNGTSDIIWEKQVPELFTKFPDIKFYDYTKHVFRCMKSYKLPENYHLTFSRSEVNDKDCRRVLRSGKCNVAVVFHGPQPDEFMGKPTFSMDEDDLRILDPNGGHVGALVAKGKAKKDKTGFVVYTGV